MTEQQSKITILVQQGLDLHQHGKLKDAQNIYEQILSNQEEVKRLSDQLNSNKLLAFFKENAKLKIKEVSYDKFIKDAYA